MRKIKGPKDDIKFKLSSIEGNEIEFDLIPLKQKKAAHVFHTVLQKVVASVSAGIPEKGEKLSMGAILKSMSENVEFDDIWFLLEQMLENAIVDDNEVGDLNTSDIFEDNPQWPYLVCYHGIKGNWPKVFSKLGAKMTGFASRIGKVVQGMEAVKDEETEKK